MHKGAKLGGATGARAPVVFIPRPEIIHICASIFVFLPEVLYIGAPLLFSPVWRQCAFSNLNSPTFLITPNTTQQQERSHIRPPRLNI